MNKRDWLFGWLTVIGLATLITFEWIPGLLLFAIGGIGLVASGASVTS